MNVAIIVFKIYDYTENTMIIRHITELGVKQPRLLIPAVISVYSKTCSSVRPVCPGSRKTPASICGGKGGGADPVKAAVNGPVRQKEPGKVRMGFIPEEWFQFFAPFTGVTGPYFLMIGLANYAASKEILVMEHEYYSGLSVVLVLYLVTTKFGRDIGSALDQGVDAVYESFQKSRNEEMAFHENTINEATLGQTRAKGQVDLMAAKKENIAFQLEAVYRERLMTVYRTVRGRMDYHMKRHEAETRIQHKCMVEWILRSVHQSITPELQKQAMRSAISELASISAKVK